MNEKERSIFAKKVTWVGFYSNAGLTAFKIFAGIQGKSAAMIADGVHSLSDFLTDIIVLVGFQFIEKPADDEHPYGHGKYETLSTLVISVALFLVGWRIFSSGVGTIYNILFNDLVLERPGVIALVAAGISILVKELLFRYTKSVGEKINSSAVIANGWHHRSDAFSSIGTLLGIGGAVILGDKWTLLDPIASVIVSIFIFKVAYEILSPSINELLESRLDESDMEEIQAILINMEAIVSFHCLRTRKIGYYKAVEMHLEFESDISLMEAHDVASLLEDKLYAALGENCIITLHLEPRSEENQIEAVI